jgi:hypothetical protein
MNGKQAKRLRKMALGLGVTLSEAGKNIPKDGYVVKDNTPRIMSPSSVMSNPVAAAEADKAAEEARALQIPKYQLFVRRDSVKGIYKQLKRGV